MASASPRIAEARGRAAAAKRAMLVAAVAGFLAVFVLARASHPGHTTAAHQPTAPSVVPASGESDDDGFGFGSGSIAPQTQNVAPSVSTHTS
jgi:hypothetical protein